MTATHLPDAQPEPGRARGPLSAPSPGQQPLTPSAGGGERVGVWNALEERCLNSCLWIYSSSVIKKKIIGCFFFFLFLLELFVTQGNSLREPAAGVCFVDDSSSFCSPHPVLPETKQRGSLPTSRLSSCRRKALLFHRRRPTGVGKKPSYFFLPPTRGCPV